MKRWLGVALGAASLVACGLLRPHAGDGRATLPVENSAQDGCPREEVLTELSRQLDECKAEVQTLVETRTEVRTRTRVVQREGPPRQCGGEGPTIVHVPTSECAAGMTCLDETGQRALALNLAAYEAWVRRVQACESAP